MCSHCLPFWEVRIPTHFFSKTLKKQAFILPFLNKLPFGNQRFDENFHLIGTLQIVNNEGMIKVECHFFVALNEMLYLGIVHHCCYYHRYKAICVCPLMKNTVPCMSLSSLSILNLIKTLTSTITKNYVDRETCLKMSQGYSPQNTDT